MRGGRIVALVAAVLCAGGGCKKKQPAGGRPDKLADVIALGFAPSADQLLADVTSLVGDPPSGRGAGTADEQAAAAYLARGMEAAGVSPGAADGSYLQTFAIAGGKSVNVIGVIAGSDPAAANEHIVLGAHIDAQGRSAGTVYPGADDNASGVAALLAVARAWQAVGFAPRRTIVLVGFGAEEVGLRGSRAYVESPSRPLDKAVAMINLDMLSRPRFYDYEKMKLAKAVAGIADGPGLGLLVGGSDRLLDLARCMARAGDMPAYAPEDFPALRSFIDQATVNRGDFAPFAERGVPFVFFSTSEHDDYHRPTDTLDTIDARVLHRNAAIVWRTTVALDLLPAPLGDQGIDCPVRD